MNDLRITLSGEAVILLPEKALLIESDRTLIVADVHLGKDTAFRSSGVPIPAGVSADSLDRLSRVIRRIEARRLIFLGDLIHARESLVEGLLSEIRSWRGGHPTIEMILVTGNHDQRSGVLPSELGIEAAADDLNLPPFILRHHPERDDRGYVLAGHVHPAVRVRLPGRSSARLPCFLFGSDYGILPAFGTFTGSHTVTPSGTDRVFVIADDCVIRL